MCGIISAISFDTKNNNVDRVIAQYQKQKHRGQRGFGYVAVKNNELIFARSTGEQGILESLKKLGNADIIVFHHRIPTCTPNAVPANHPLFIANKKNLQYKYFLIHNGMISNAEEMKKLHEQEGFVYRSNTKFKYFENATQEHDSFTDSESLGIEMAMYIEGKSQAMFAKGSIACFLLQVDKNNVPIALYYYRNSNPIKFFRNQHGMLLSSEGGGVELESHKLFRYDLASTKVEISDVVTELEESEEDTKIIMVSNSGEIIPQTGLEKKYSLEDLGISRPRTIILTGQDRLNISERDCDFSRLYEVTENSNVKRLIEKHMQLVLEMEDNISDIRDFERDGDKEEMNSFIDASKEYLKEQKRQLNKLEVEIIAEAHSEMYNA